MLAYRLFKRRFSDSPMSGEGARLFGGRWNSKGREMIYAADSLSLAVMEVFVHVPNYREILDSYCWIEIDVPDADIETLSADELPRDWSAPDNRETQHIGDTWLERQCSLGLLAPSAVVPRGGVLLLNPLHPRFKKLRWSAPQSCAFDERLANRDD